MAYATRVQFGQYGLPAGAITDEMEGRIEDELEAASGKMDGYLRPKHALPLATPYPLELVKACCSLAALELLTVEGFGPEGDEIYINRAAETMRWLRDLAAGRASLSQTVDATPTKREGKPKIKSRDARGWRQTDA